MAMDPSVKLLIFQVLVRYKIQIIVGCRLIKSVSSTSYHLLLVVRYVSGDCTTATYTISNGQLCGATKTSDSGHQFESFQGEVKRGSSFKLIKS